MNSSLEVRARAFWRWFSSVEHELASDFANETILRELDRQVTLFGSLTWEVAPGVTRPNALVISPGGSTDLLDLSREIVKFAPDMPEWEIHPAKPPKRWDLRFVVKDENGTEHGVDAREWQYILLRFPDGTFDVVICAKNVGHLDRDMRQVAGEVAVDGIVGEDARLRHIADINVVTEFDTGQRRGATSLTHLAGHLASLTA